MAGAANIIDVTEATFEFEVIQRSHEIPVVVDFWAPWCGPCVAIAPVMEDLAAEYGGKVKIAKMNVDENANIPATLGVRSIPYIALFKGGKLIDSIVGVVPKNKLKEMIDKSL